MSYETLLVEVKQGVGVIWLNRPERQNTLDRTMVEELSQALLALEKDSGVRVIVLAGSGACFCAGNDRDILIAMAEDDQETNGVETLKIAKLFQTLYNLSKPSLARVHGCALNCGAALAAACDMAVGEYGAEFSLSDLRIGMIPATLTPYVTKAMGERWARHHFLCGETFTAAEAYRTGLLTDITPPEELDGRINELLGQIIQGAPDAQTALKAWMRASAGMPITPEIVKTGADMTAASCTADEFKRGLDDIIAKRKPFWLKKKPSSPSKKPARQKS